MGAGSSALALAPLLVPLTHEVLIVTWLLRSPGRELVTQPLSTGTVTSVVVVSDVIGYMHDLAGYPLVPRTSSSIILARLAGACALVFIAHIFMYRRL